jgi:hypothetical protein
MSDTNIDTTSEAGDETAPVHTEAVNSEDVATPKVEFKDGKTFVNGVRVYSREDTNKIAANARKETESKILQDLEVDSFDSVKQVVKSLQGHGDEPTLDVQSLRDAVKKREATVEELKAELQRVKTESVLKEHLGLLQTSMPSAWNNEQRSAVLDLMKARNMLVLEGETFAIRNGDSFITDGSGEKPDYTAAVQLIGKTLGLPMSKVGVATFDSPDSVVSDPQSRRALDAERMKSDAQYRSAYIRVREQNKNLAHGDITDAMIRKQIEGTSAPDLRGRALHTSSATPTKKGR